MLIAYFEWRLSLAWLVSNSLGGPAPLVFVRFGTAPLVMAGDVDDSMRMGLACAHVVVKAEARPNESQPLPHFAIGVLCRAFEAAMKEVCLALR